MWKASWNDYKKNKKIKNSKIQSGDEEKIII